MIVKKKENGELRWIWAYGKNNEGQMILSVLDRDSWNERQLMHDDDCAWLSRLEHLTLDEVEDTLVSRTDTTPEEDLFNHEGDLSRPLWYVNLLSEDIAACHQERLYAFVVKFMELERATGGEVDTEYAIKQAQLLHRGVRDGRISDNGLVAWSASEL